jgi:hypothetical protein
VVFATAVAFGAQSSTTTQDRPTTAPQQQPSTATPPATTTTEGAGQANAAPVTLTGCLKEAPSAAATAGSSTTAENPTGTAGAGASTPAATAGESKFVLEHATMSTAAASTTPGSPGATTAPGDAATTTSGSTAPGRTYKLIAKDSALAPHVGKKVELTGTVQEDAASGTPRLLVQSGKAFSTDCQ